MWRVGIIAMVILWSSAAWGLEGVLRAGGDAVIVWKSKDDMSKGLDLVSANVHKTNPPLVFRHVACMVPSGTKAVSHGFGLLTKEITVIDTKWSGCRGIVPMEMFQLP